jgi:DNA-binding response OmpR family regulator
VEAVRGEATPATVLLVEDDETIGRNLLVGLRAHGYAATWCRTGAAALIEARENPYDLVLLDLGLPDVDGTDLARDLRHRSPDLLIVMLTARSDDIDVVVGLDVGADDYLVKPVPLSVLLARLRAHLRRHHPARPPDAPPERLLTAGDLRLDAAARTCHLADVAISLRPKEFDLLAELLAQPGIALRREDLMATVWDEHWFGSTKTLDVTMAALRRRLQDAEGPAAARAPTITTLRGHGYRLEPPA